MFEYSQLSIGNHPLVLESIIAQQSDDSDDYIIDSRMAHLFAAATAAELSNGGSGSSSSSSSSGPESLDQLKYLSKVNYLFCYQSVWGPDDLDLCPDLLNICLVQKQKQKEYIHQNTGRVISRSRSKL